MQKFLKNYIQINPIIAKAFLRFIGVMRQSWRHNILRHIRFRNVVKPFERWILSLKCYSRVEDNLENFLVGHLVFGTSTSYTINNTNFYEKYRNFLTSRKCVSQIRPKCDQKFDHGLETILHCPISLYLKNVCNQPFRAFDNPTI